MNSMVDLSSSLCKRLPEGTWDTTCDDFLVRKVSFRIIGFRGSKMLTQRQARTGVIPLRPQICFLVDQFMAYDID